MIAKKIGLLAVYYFLASLIDQLLVMFFGNVYTLTFGGAALCICIISYSFKINYILKRNYVQEERDAYNTSFKTKIKHIISSKEFIAEMIIGAVVSVIFMLIPRFAVGISYFFTVLYFNRAYMLIFAVLFAVADIVIWLLAYRKCFRKKKY